jgi:hypothetical protein
MVCFNRDPLCWSWRRHLPCSSLPFSKQGKTLYFSCWQLRSRWACSDRHRNHFTGYLSSRGRILLLGDAGFFFVFFIASSTALAGQLGSVISASCSLALAWVGMAFWI